MRLSLENGPKLAVGSQIAVKKNSSNSNTNMSINSVNNDSEIVEQDSDR